MIIFPNIELCTYFGSIQRPNGNKGELYISLSKLSDFEYKKIQFLFVQINSDLVPCKVEELIIKNSSALLKLQTIDTIEKAERFSKLPLYVENKYVAYKEEDEESEIIGFDIYNNSDFIGKIKDIIQYPMQEVIVVEYKDTDVLIPFVEAYITDVDVANKKIIFNLPEGLLEI